MVHNSKFKKISVALCLALVPISVFAAGLGKLNVNSGIGEPLKADIELLSVSPEELASITAAIASEEAYATQGIERPASHNSIKVELAKNASGAPILKLKSAQPIDEPFLDMLIQVDWNTGRLLREYTVLLDPPGYTGESGSSVQPAQTPRLPTASAGTSSKDNMAQSTDGTTSSAKKNGHKVRAKPSSAAGMESSAAVIGEEYETKSGDTLGKIARAMKPEGVSLDQMLVGLYEANKEAFDGNNMNRLKVGQIIRPPSEDALAAISRQEASHEVKVQATDWNEYRNKLAGMVSEAPVMDDSVSAQSASGKIKSSAEDQSKPSGSGPKDVVKLSAGESQNNAEETKSLQAKVAALQEEITAREKGLKEAQERTAALEKQIADMQKLLELKNGAMAEMQKQAEAQSVEGPKPEPTPVEKNQTAAPVEKTAPVAEPQVTKPVIKPPPVPPEPVEEPSFFDGLVGGMDSTLMAGAGGLVALLGGAWFYLRNKRKKNLADFEQGIMTSGGLKANTVFGNTSGSSVDTGDTSFLTDFSQSAHGGMIDTNDVDPIAEAEVYMAYGRDAQAEEILKDAISKEPKRYELHLKLLEMYAASKNMSAFEAVSGELYTTLGASDPTWAKVAEIGIKLEPNNPLYQVSGTFVASKDIGAEGKLEASDFSDSPLAADTDLDFSLLDTTEQSDSFESTNPMPEEMDGGLAFGGEDLDTTATPDENMADSISTSELPDTEDMPLESPQPDSAALDFDMGEVAEDSAPVIEAESSFAHTMPNLDFPKFETGAEDSMVALPTLDVTEESLPTFETVEGQEAAKESLELPQVNMDNALDIAQAEDATEEEQNNFGFDINTISPEMSMEDESMAEANTLDLSGISLEMSDAVEESEELELKANEPEEVETKLELVAAYIEMDDKEGAKELLDEVMREGGATQRKRAETLLTKLG